MTKQLTKNISVKNVLIVMLAVIMVFSVMPMQTHAASKIKLSKCKITLAYSADVYTGAKKTPKVTVKYKGKTLTKGKSYTVKYYNNVKPGTAKVKIKAKGNKYEGTVTKSFRIYSKAVSQLKANVVSGDSIQVSWNKTTGSRGYRLTVTSDGKAYKKGTYETSGTAYKFTEMPADKTYTFKIVSLAGPNKTASQPKTISVTLNAITTMEAPKLTAGSPGYRRCDLSWSGVPKASGYTVSEYNVTSKTTTETEVADSEELSYAFYDKAAGSKYQYKVQAYALVNGEKIKGKWSNAVDVTAQKTLIGQACSNYDKVAGDSSGKEVKRSNYTTSSSSSSCYNWTYVFRFKDPEKAEAAAANMERGIDNNNIGYCSNGTSTYGSNALQYQAAKVGYDLSKISVKTGCSCGDIVTICVIYSGITSCKYTGSGLDVARQLLKLSGDFECFSGTEYTRSDKYLQRGDILVTAHSSGKNNHVAMVL